MERTLISWNVPNLITIWLMLAIGFLLLTLALQFAQGAMSPSNNTTAGSGGY